MVLSIAGVNPWCLCPPCRPPAGWRFSVPYGVCIGGTFMRGPRGSSSWYYRVCKAVDQLLDFLILQILDGDWVMMTDMAAVSGNLNLAVRG